jgi:hypothetical protein
MNERDTDGRIQSDVRSFSQVMARLRQHARWVRFMPDDGEPWCTHCGGS